MLLGKWQHPHLPKLGWHTRPTQTDCPLKHVLPAGRSLCCCCRGAACRLRLCVQLLLVPQVLQQCRHRPCMCMTQKKKKKKKKKHKSCGVCRVLDLQLLRRHA